ncbi:hypothetical protein HMPREF9412_2654 [Paenibacillus sp. HGF5]|nr:hypothetical protein HMPREF9412_2654 [Paenibacillus sp. HGF5]
MKEQGLEKPKRLDRWFFPWMGILFETKSFLVRINYHMSASRYICLCKRQAAEPVLSK